jgi:mono/diheme cytochrome c family protein
MIGRNPPNARHPAALAALVVAVLSAATVRADEPAPTGATTATEVKATANAAPDAGAAAAATDAAQEPPKPALNVKKMFATNCSWCHDDYGMAAGKGPRLAGTSMTEQQVAQRIRNGKDGAMPAFRKTLSEEQIAAFASYIKSLKPQD